MQTKLKAVFVHTFIYFYDSICMFTVVSSLLCIANLFHCLFLGRRSITHLSIYQLIWKLLIGYKNKSITMRNLLLASICKEYDSGPTFTSSLFQLWYFDFRNTCFDIPTLFKLKAKVNTYLGTYIFWLISSSKLCFCTRKPYC